MTKLQADKDAEHLSDSVQEDRTGKHVSFPPDEEIVSGFAECKDTQRAGEFRFAVIELAYKFPNFTLR